MKELIKEMENMRAKLLEVMLNIPYDFEPDHTIAITQVADFLKKLIDRGDNIVDLGVVWHTQEDEPEKLRQIVAEKIDGNSIGGYYEEDGYNELACKFVPQGIYRDVMLIDGQWKKVDFISNWDEIKRWAYLEDLLPKRGQVMGYHEIGERFAHDGVVLEVAFALHCSLCFFCSKKRCQNMKCLGSERKDKTFVHYKLVKSIKN